MAGLQHRTGLSPLIARTLPHPVIKVKLRTLSVRKATFQTLGKSSPRSD
jgi:hypothetical protein